MIQKSPFILNPNRTVAANGQIPAERRPLIQTPLSEGILATYDASAKQAPRPVSAIDFMREAGSRLDSILESLKSIREQCAPQAQKEGGRWAEFLNTVCTLENEIRPSCGMFKGVSEKLTVEGECRVLNLVTSIQINLDRRGSGKIPEEIRAEYLRITKALETGGFLLDKKTPLIMDDLANAHNTAKLAKSLLELLGAKEESISSMSSVIVALDSYSSFVNVNCPRVSKRNEPSTPFEEYARSCRAVHSFLGNKSAYF